MKKPTINAAKPAKAPAAKIATKPATIAAKPGPTLVKAANAARGGMAHDGSLRGSNMHSDRPMRHEKY